MNSNKQTHSYYTYKQKISDYFNDVTFYDTSVHFFEDSLLFIIKIELEKHLIIIGDSLDFNGIEIIIDAELKILKCELNPLNTRNLRDKFDFTKPVLIGNKNSFGFGDRLGNAGVAHLKSLKNHTFVPILAQQSIRELKRTHRTAIEVLDAASWAVFSLGYHDGFGADGDHIKTTDDLDYFVEAGYTMFTIDPSDFIHEDVKHITKERLLIEYEKVPWNELLDSPDQFLLKFQAQEITLASGLVIQPSESEIMEGIVKYGRVITHTKKLHDHLKSNYSEYPFELELSVDESKHPTSIFEHYLIVSELHKLGVELVSFAPRFCGDFEKGIEFKGDIDEFVNKFVLHTEIAKEFKDYKLSIHSGSDKFMIYQAIGSLEAGNVHVKTAGTSYLEALRTIAVCDPNLFREIMLFSIKRFDEDKKNYHISANLDHVRNPNQVKDDELRTYLDDDHARQVLHVTYGSVLSGNYQESRSFKPSLLKSLEENEELYHRILLDHFEKHLSSFN